MRVTNNRKEIPWTDEEREIIRKHYAERGARGIRQEFFIMQRRRLQDIRAAARRLGVKMNGPAKRGPLTQACPLTEDQLAARIELARELKREHADISQLDF